jgi:hypothetical protein
MEDWRLLAVNENNEVFEIRSDKEPLEWTWVGENRDRQDLYNKLLEGGWDVSGQRSENQIMIRRLKQ